MKAHNCRDLMERLAGILGIASAGVLISFPIETCMMSANASSHQTNYSISGTKLTADRMPSSSQEMAQATNRNIVAVAAANPAFKTLTAALKAAGLTETLAGTGPFTVFAPTDTAFNALPKGTLQSLLKSENKAKLVKVLTYHMINGKVTSDQLKSGSVTTVEGNSVQVNVANGKVTVNGATVTSANVPATNGVIHVINKVILPPNL